MLKFEKDMEKAQSVEEMKFVLRAFTKAFNSNGGN